MSNDNLTPAQELRAAASKIRDLTSGIPAGPWSMRDAWRHAGDTVYVKRIANAEHETVLSACPSGRDVEALPSTFEHIALWHPGVAELVADWLENVAEIEEHGFRQASSSALAVARAINGGAR